jgi:mono/diheme cytochrome c family protein
VRYRGRIDDQIERSVRRPTATSHDLVDAVKAVLAGQPVATPVTAVVGCPLPGKRTTAAGAATVTYTQHVASILQQQCQECHRPGEIGPFALMNYTDASNWSAAIREVVAENIMPPWHADPKHGRFRNERRLSDADKKTLLAWIDQGCAEGDAKHLPPARTYTTGWGIGQPDVVLKMTKPYKVPANAPKNGIPYQFFAVGEPFAEDKWITAAEVRPGNRGVVHHIIVHMFPPGMKVPGQLPSLQDLTNALTQKPAEPMAMPEWLTAYVPGDRPVILPPGLARKIPKGTQLVFELHYTPNGRAGTDVSTLGLIFAAGPPKHQVAGDMLINEGFTIPPGAANHRVTASKPVPVDCMLISMNPHMHLRGKSFQYDLILPGGQRETLLSVPKYDFNWQETYILAEPRRLPKGSTIECIAHYDNSKANPNNPNPNKSIHWGDQTWDEMMLGYLEYYVAPK